MYKRHCSTVRQFIFGKFWDLTDIPVVSCAKFCVYMLSGSRVTGGLTWESQESVLALITPAWTNVLSYNMFVQQIPSFVNSVFYRDVYNDLAYHVIFVTTSVCKNTSAGTSTVNRAESEWMSSQKIIMVYTTCTSWCKPCTTLSCEQYWISKQKGDFGPCRRKPPQPMPTHFVRAGNNITII